MGQGQLGGSGNISGGGMTNPIKYKSMYTDWESLPPSQPLLTSVANSTALTTSPVYNNEGLADLHAYIEVDTPAVPIGTMSNTGTITIALMSQNDLTATYDFVGTNRVHSYRVTQPNKKYLLYYQMAPVPPVWWLKITNLTGVTVQIGSPNQTFKFVGGIPTQVTDYYYTPTGALLIGGNAARLQVGPAGNLVLSGSASVTTSQGNFVFLAPPSED